MDRGRELAKNVLDHDHRAIDDDAEVHRAQRKQVGRDADEGQAKEGGEQRERNGNGDDRGGAQIAEKHPQHDRNQKRALDEVGEHRGQRLADQPGAVVDRHHLDARGQAGVVHLVDRGAHRLEHFGRILAAAHQHHAGHDIVVVVLTGDALPRHRADRYLRDVLDKDRRAASLGDHHVANVLWACEKAYAADQVLLAALLDIAAAGIGVAALDRL